VISPSLRSNLNSFKIDGIISNAAVVRNMKGRIFVLKLILTTSWKNAIIAHEIAVAIIRYKFVLLSGWRISCQIFL
jgi:hypothetical protein